MSNTNITDFTFFKNSKVWFPIMPIEVKGNITLSKSNYLWEYTKLSDEEMNEKQRLQRKSRNLADDDDIWKACKHNDDETPTFFVIPDESLLNAKLRLTIEPSNDGTRFGKPLIKETPDRISNPIPDEFLFEERFQRLNPKPKSNPNYLRVITYNTLASFLATPEWFKNSPPDSLPIDYRLPIICKELSLYDGDIICLQEVDSKYYGPYYAPLLSTYGYSGLYSRKTNDTKEGVAVFYKNKELKSLESNTYVIKDEMEKLPFYNVLANNANISTTLSKRNTVLRLAALESLTCNAIVIIGNIHLYSHPQASHIRLLQVKTATKLMEIKVEEMKQKFPKKKVTVIFCGDFNCLPEFSAVRFLTTGKILETDVDWTSHPTEKLEPGIELTHNLAFLNSHPKHELTNIVQKFEGCLDYIFYQPNIELTSICGPPSKAKIAQICGIPEKEVAIPNFHAPSDHLPLIADFNL